MSGHHDISAQLNDGFEWA